MMNCPYCKSPHVSCDEVDIGVGMIQCGPYGCEDCHASQVHPDTHKSELWQVELECGWHEPPIETVPKDRRMVIVRAKDGKEYVAYWSEERFVGNFIDVEAPLFVTHALLIEDLVSWRPHDQTTCVD